MRLFDSAQDPVEDLDSQIGTRLMLLQPRVQVRAIDQLLSERLLGYLRPMGMHLTMPRRSL